MRIPALFLLLASGLASFGLQAQTAKSEKAEAVAVEYGKALSLDAEQREALTKVFAQHLQASRENWQAVDGDHAAFADRQQETFKTTDTRIKALLNDDQLAAYMDKRLELKKKALDHYVTEAVHKH
jgi:hypothetical protein